MMNKSLFAALAVLTISNPAYALFAQCDGPNENHVQFPKDALIPVWEMCYLIPSDSSAADGSGLELREVYYNGHLVFNRLHSPMLFAEYESGTCYRDWKDADSSFLADNILISGILAEPQVATETTCDLSDTPVSPVGDCPFGGQGSHTTCHTGVAVERDESVRGFMTLTTQYSAAWYKYSSRVTFDASGGINLEFGFGNNNGTNSDDSHNHVNYWRMDFDIDGSASNDQVFEDATLKNSEFLALRDASGASNGGPLTWSVIDADSGRGYQLIPGANDYNQSQDPWGRGYHEVHLMATQFQNGEYGDLQTNPLGACQMNENALVDGQSLSNQDIVLYYSAGVTDTTGPENGGAGDTHLCKKAGPSLQTIGNWTADLFFFDRFGD